MYVLQVVNAFIDKGAIPKKHVKLFTATKDLDLCTFEGMRASFQEVAGDVGEDGLFIFQFSGHGLNLQSRSEGQFGLVPADFDDTMATFITGSILNQWLIDSKCKAPHVIFILDCCYAGGLGNDLTAGVTNLRSGLYVMSASTAFEASLVIQPLGNSLFTYFLAYAIRKFQFVPGTFPVSRVFDECRDLCIAVSSLMVSYHEHHGLLFDRFKPEMHFFDVTTGKDLEKKVSALIEESLTRSSTRAPPHQPTYMFSKFSFVLKYYTTQKWLLWRRRKGHQLHELCRNWLLFISGSLSPLQELANRGLLNDEVLRAVVCLMMWSIASIQIASEELKSVTDPNLFLVGFLYAAAALDSFQSCPVTLEELKEAWGFYQAVLDRHKLRDDELHRVHERIQEDLGAEKEARKAQLERPLDTASSLPPHMRDRICLDGGTEEAKEVRERSKLEPILEESAVTSLTSNGTDESQEPQSPGPTSLESKEDHTATWTVDIPELSTMSPGVGSSVGRNSIVPSMRRESILPTLTKECKIPPELLDDHAVVADTLVLQTLQVSLSSDWR